MVLSQLLIPLLSVLDAPPLQLTVQIKHPPPGVVSLGPEGKTTAIAAIGNAGGQGKEEWREDNLESTNERYTFTFGPVERRRGRT
jgi:hypothetical protein